jgi:uncharacterized OB-fold protein
MNNSYAGMVPSVPYLKIDESGEPYLTGSRCGACGQIFFGERDICARCAARGKMEKIRLGGEGKLYSYTIIHRSFPGVKTPFVAATVDLDEGGTLKGTLLDVEPDPANLSFDMAVRVVFRDSGQKDKDGRPYLNYYFVPKAH